LTATPFPQRGFCGSATKPCLVGSRRPRRAAVRYRKSETVRGSNGFATAHPRFGTKALSSWTCFDGADPGAALRAGWVGQDATSWTCSRRVSQPVAPSARVLCGRAHGKGCDRGRSHDDDAVATRGPGLSEPEVGFARTRFTLRCFCRSAPKPCLGLGEAGPTQGADFCNHPTSPKRSAGISVTSQPAASARGLRVLDSGKRCDRGRSHYVRRVAAAWARVVPDARPCDIGSPRRLAARTDSRPRTLGSGRTL